MRRKKLKKQLPKRSNANLVKAAYPCYQAAVFWVVGDVALRYHFVALMDRDIGKNFMSIAKCL